MNLEKELEAILFVSGEEIEIKELASFFEKSENEIKDLLMNLQESIKERGINIKINKKSVQLLTNRDCGEVINRYFFPEKKPKKLTKAAMETVAIIAYNQPTTKSEVEKIRGVNVERVIHNLEERDLIMVTGKKSTIGTPKLYSVTDEFLSYMGIDRVEELPKYEEVSCGKN